MIDIQLIRKNPDGVKHALLKRIDDVMLQKWVGKSRLERNQHVS
jgi:hypothetical protein